MGENFINSLGAMAESVSIIYKVFIDNGIPEAESVSLTAITLKYIFKPLHGDEI